MADSKISALTDGTAPSGTDKFPIARSGANNALTWTEMLAAVKAVTLDQFATAAGNIAMGTHKLTGLAAGSGAGDSLRYEQLFSAGAVPIADIADPTTGMVIGSASNAAAAVFPPGYEIGYDENTASVSVTVVTEASSTTIIAGSSHTFDGAPVMAHFFSPIVTNPTTTGTEMAVCLFESSTEIGRMGALLSTVTGSGTGVPFSCFRRFTPTAGTHTYSVKAFMFSGSGASVVGGPTGTAAFMTSFLRFTKV